MRIRWEREEAEAVGILKGYLTINNGIIYGHGIILTVHWYTVHYTTIELKLTLRIK